VSEIPPEEWMALFFLVIPMWLAFFVLLGPVLWRKFVAWIKECPLLDEPTSALDDAAEKD